ncbi:MAG: asparagine synthase-related protein, partial [Gammaproteobacteria bacterium]|nr:asparagine synthase-related protein [Gammaproteobacteria bacterium]
EYWRKLYALPRTKDKLAIESYYIDLEASIRGRDYDRSCSFLKARLVASHTNNSMFYPYCNDELIDYCFNLPEQERFDMSRYINKILLRKLLNEKVQYDTLANKKFGFNFEGREFIRQHKKFITHEILNCSAWESEKMGPFLTRSMKLLDKNYYESHGIILLFLLSGWINHNQYMSR